MPVINYLHVNWKNRPKQLYHTTIPTRRPVLHWILSPKKRVQSLKPWPLQVKQNRLKQLYHINIPTRRPVLHWILSPKKRVHCPSKLNPQFFCQKTKVSAEATKKHWREHNALTNGSRKYCIYSCISRPFTTKKSSSTYIRVIQKDLTKQSENLA